MMTPAVSPSNSPGHTPGNWYPTNYQPQRGWLPIVYYKLQL